MIGFNIKKPETKLAQDEVTNQTSYHYRPPLIYQRISVLAVLILLLTSCGNTKYHYHFERGSMVDFTQGEWILNKPYTNYNEERISKVKAHKL